jgi:lipopolysaccharide/colanic/teichoic acid biosynthesis glycosyltransferase
MSSVAPHSASRPVAAVHKTAARQPGTDPSYVLGEDVFRAALGRELKRADRSDESFALLVVSSVDGSRETTWRYLVEALVRTKSDTDVIGWWKLNAGIGLIRPLAHLEPAESLAILAARVQHELGVTAGRETAARYSMSLQVFSHQRVPVAPTAVYDGGHSQKTWVDWSKRTLDLAGSAVLLVLLSPLLLLITALIKATSKGPVLFCQTRIGQYEQPFTMLKFRTMHANADQAIHEAYTTEFITSNIAAARGGGNVFKIVDDPRVTRLGHFLRRSSLDELPQVWNVLLGDMSLVGPRPALPYELARYKRWHRRRLTEVKPGITGLWQVTGRSRTTFDEMVRLDLQYAKSRSLWADIKILVATPRAVFSGRGAH